MLLLKQPLPLFRPTKGKKNILLRIKMVMFLGTAEWKGKVPLQTAFENLEFKRLYLMKCKSF